MTLTWPWQRVAPSSPEVTTATLDRSSGSVTAHVDYAKLGAVLIARRALGLSVEPSCALRAPERSSMMTTHDLTPVRALVRVLARRNPVDDAKTDQYVRVLATRYSRAQLNGTLRRLTAVRAPSRSHARQVELLRRARAQTYLPLNRRLRRTTPNLVR